MHINLMIADDHSLVREGLIQLLELDDELVVIGEASDGDETIKMVSEKKPDVLLLDINMPKKNGIEVLKALKEANTNTKIVILTIHDEVEYLIKSIDIGCDGYVLKDSNSEILKSAIYTVFSGENFIQPSLIPILNEGLVTKQKSSDKLDELTRREIEVLKLLAEGMFNKEIASKLSISERTVKNHVSNIFKKIGVSDRTQAAVFAIRNELVDIK